MLLPRTETRRRKKRTCAGQTGGSDYPRGKRQARRYLLPVRHWTEGRRQGVRQYPHWRGGIHSLAALPQTTSSACTAASAEEV